MSNPYQHIQYLLGAAKYQQLPADQGIEIAFIGRSNAGKSSAINSITGIHGLARTSKTPGRTQLINLFQVDEQRRLVDLPGYGYAKAPEAIKLQWQQTVHHYLQQRRCLHGLIVIMDIRHPLQPLDWQLLQWAKSRPLITHILLTKADKLTRQQAKRQLEQVQQQLKAADYNASTQVFSALRKMGIEEARMQLASWLNISYA